MITYHELSHVLCCCLKLYFLKLFLFWFFEFLNCLNFFLFFFWSFFFDSFLFFFSFKEGGSTRDAFTQKSRGHGSFEARLIFSSLNLRVSWKPVNPQECVWKETLPKKSWTISQEKVTIHFSITIWYTYLFLCLRPWRFPQQKSSQWIRNGRNLKRFRRGTWQKSETNQRWSMKQGRRAYKFIFPHWWTPVIWRLPNWRQSTKKQRSSRTPRWYCERRFGVLCSIHRTRVISITNDSSKSYGYHLQTARVRRTSSWCSIC